MDKYEHSLSQPCSRGYEPDGLLTRLAGVNHLLDYLGEMVGYPYRVHGRNYHLEYIDSTLYLRDTSETLHDISSYTRLPATALRAMGQLRAFCGIFHEFRDHILYGRFTNGDRTYSGLDGRKLGLNPGERYNLVQEAKRVGYLPNT